MKLYPGFATALTAGWLMTEVQAQFPAGFGSSMSGTEIRTTILIRADGHCETSTENVQSRSVAEQSVRMYERSQKMQERFEAGDFETPAGTQPAETAPKPYTDAELEKKVLESARSQYGEDEEDPDKKFKVEIGKDTVRLLTTRSFASLEALLQARHSVWWEAGLYFDNVRFEKTTNSLLQVTLTPRAEMQRYLRTVRSQWRMSGMKTEFKLVFPGKVLASGFPAKATNATWLIIDGKQDETLDATQKLYEQPTIITAELGGLKLDQPLESETLQRTARRGGSGGADAADDLPLTDAGPGFLAEPQSVTITTVHVFPEGEKHARQAGAYSLQQTGVVVSAKLFAPKGRTMLSTGGVKIVKATDDKGRPVGPKGGSAEDADTSEYRSFSSGSREVNATPIQLQLSLPESDAQSIDEIAAETVAITAGSWKQLVLTNIQEGATNEIDLAEVLPGAKMMFKKVSAKGRRVSAQIQITGPPAIQRLDFQARTPGNREGNSYTSDTNFRRKAGQSTRTVSVQTYNYDPEGDATTSGPVTIVVRYPQDLRRDRVRFTLKGLDLL